jgi:hypothetical protein
MATYDTHIQLLAPEVQERTGKFFGFGYVASVAIRGPQKLINRWLKCLLTPKGSDPREPAYGTGFTGLIGSNISSNKDVYDALTLFVEDCNNQIRAMDIRSFPPDEERLESATVAGVVPHASGDGFEVYVRLRNAAGLVVALQLPSVSR